MLTYAPKFDAAEHWEMTGKARMVDYFIDLFILIFLIKAGCNGQIYYLSSN